MHTFRLLLGPLGLLLACGPGAEPPTDEPDSGMMAEKPADGGGVDGGALVDAGPPPDGESIFRSPISTSSSFACATCHALKNPEEAGLRRPGHPLDDAFHRPSFKNGQVGTLLEASNVCLLEWMRASAPWTETTPEWLGLSSFLESIAPEGPARPLSYELVAPPPDVAGGDIARGQVTHNEACSICHGMDGAGSSLGPPLRNTGIDGAFIARKVRTSGPRESVVHLGLAGGTMPFWSARRLSDDELRDIITFLLSP